MMRERGYTKCGNPPLVIVLTALWLLSLLASTSRDSEQGSTVFRSRLENRLRVVIVRNAMRREFQVVDSHDMLEQAIQVLQQSGSRFLPVEHNGGLVGMLTLENVGEFMMIRSALRHASLESQTSKLSA